MRDDTKFTKLCGCHIKQSVAKMFKKLWISSKVINKMNKKQIYELFFNIIYSKNNMNKNQIYELFLLFSYYNKNKKINYSTSRTMQPTTHKCIVGYHFVLCLFYFYYERKSFYLFWKSVTYFRWKYSWYPFSNIIYYLRPVISEQIVSFGCWTFIILTFRIKTDKRYGNRLYFVEYLNRVRHSLSDFFVNQPPTFTRYLTNTMVKLIRNLD